MISHGSAVRRVLFSLPVPCVLFLSWMVFDTSKLQGQSICPPVPAYSVCDITFDVPAGTDSTGIELNAEFRGPSHRTFLVHAFRSGSNRLIVRFSPFEPGVWEARLSSTLVAFHDKQFQITATVSASPGWVEPANVQHFRYTGGDRQAHLWTGDTVPDGLSRPDFEQWTNERAAAGVNHLRVSVPSAIDEAAFVELDARLGYMNSHEIAADLVLVPPSNADRQARQKYFAYVVDRCAARNATWVILDEFEKYDAAHDLLREIAGYLDADPYHHLRTAGSRITSAPFADEKWMNLRYYGSSDWAVSAIENQIYPTPSINVVRASNGDDFRHLLWNMTISGAYPEAATSDAASLNYLRVWKRVFKDTRHWELQPFFDATGARGLALPLTEYVLYVEKPGPVTVQLDQKHKWDVAWINPLTGEETDEKSPKTDTYTGEPPDKSHDWVLYIDREGHKESLKSYRFESQPVLLQEIEVNPAKVPFEIAQPSGESLPFDKPVPFAAKLKRETRATRTMLYLWTGEITADGENYRALGTGASGSFQIPVNIVRHFPATLHLRLYGLNALGKLYSVDQNYGSAK